MMMRVLSAAIVLGSLSLPARATLFDFNSAGQYSPLPIDQVSDGITAHCSGAYSVQMPTVSGVTPAGFTGLCLAPSSINKADLTITFSTPLSYFSVLYAPQELACDSSATMRVTTYMDDAYVGTNTQVAQAGTWPSETLWYASPASGFNKVVIHYDSPPPTGGDYGVFFLADNVNVTALPVPEPASLGVLGMGILGLLCRKWSKRS